MPHLHVFVCYRRWCDEPQKGLSERPGPGRLSGLVVQKKGEQRALGLEVEKILVCAQEMFTLLVHIGHGKLCGFPLIKCDLATENVNKCVDVLTVHLFSYVGNEYSEAKHIEQTISIECCGFDTEYAMNRQSLEHSFDSQRTFLIKKNWIL